MPRCSPSRAPRCPRPGTPGEDKRQGFRVVGMPTQGTVSGWSLWSPSLSPDPTGLSPPSLRGEPPCNPPHPRLCPEPGETATSVPVPLARGTGWRDTPLPQLQAEGGLQGVHGSPPSSKRVVGPGKAEGPAGQLCACPGQGGEAPWGKVGRPRVPGVAGRPGPWRVGRGLGKHAQREQMGHLSPPRPTRGAPWALGCRQGPPSQHRGGRRHGPHGGRSQGV